MKADCCALRAPAIRDGIRTPAYRPSSSFRPRLPSPHRLAMKADCCALRAPAIRDGIRTPAYRPSSSFRLARTMPIWSCMQACAHIVAVRDFHRKKNSSSDVFLSTSEPLFPFFFTLSHTALEYPPNNVWNLPSASCSSAPSNRSTQILFTDCTPLWHSS